MFYNFRNIPVSLNNQKILISDLSLSQDIALDSPYLEGDRISERNLPKEPYKGSLKLKYYLTGQDYLKYYIYSNHNHQLTGNIGGLTFSQGYLSNYVLSCVPNSPVEISASLDIFDKISGNFLPSNYQISTGQTLNLSDVAVNTYPTFTQNILNNITQVNFNYQCNIIPSYEFIDTGIPPTKANRVSINERNISTEIISDDVNFNLPLSGENYGLQLIFNNPFNNSINETFACSGNISSKSLNVSAPGTHLHSIKIQQNHLNNMGGISGVIINTGGFFDIYSTDNSNPWTINNSNLKYIDKIMVGDTECLNFTITKQSTYDQITVTTPYNITNDILTIYGANGTYIWQNPLVFNYSGIIINNLSQYSGSFGTPITITGTNFYRISNVLFGQASAPFQVINSNLIQTIVPYGGTTSKINIISNSRNLTGISNNLFSCQPSIITMTPVTGQWKDNLTIGGSNFSGITDIYFNNIPAYSFSILNNSLITLQTPETGAGFPTGYIIIYGSGGNYISPSRYNPQVPTYNISPLSGLYLDKVTLYTKIDKGYLYPSGNGFKIRFGNVDTSFYISGNNYTGALTGQVPIGAVDDYIYIYQPDGISTYNPYSIPFNVIGQPTIYSFLPQTINQFNLFNSVIYGQNMKYFHDQNYYLMLSGGINNDVQKFSNVVSNSGGVADTATFNSLIITGSTGYYNAIVQNFAGTSNVFTGALYVTSGIDQARSCLISTSSKTNILGQVQGGVELLSPLYAIDGYTSNPYAYLDVGINTIQSFAALTCTNINSGSYYSIKPKNNNLINISSIVIEMDGFSLKPINDTNDGVISINNPTGALALYYKNSNIPFYDSNFINLSGYITKFSNTLTGVSELRISTTGLGPTKYLGLSEVKIY